MKITLDIPDWAMEGDLRLIRNNLETIAHKENGADSPWQIKEVRCNNCGECCLDVGQEFMYGDDEGKCKFLIKESDGWKCNAGGMRLIGCLGDPDTNEYDECSIKYKVIQ